MFVVVQLPFADIRPLLADDLGRTVKPDWIGPPPQDAFVRGFGKISARNAKSYGLLGERFFADFDNAARLRRPLSVHQTSWPRPLQSELRFRRLYYDGRISGRLEFGFLFPDEDLAMLQAAVGDLAIDPRNVARAALESPIDVLSPGCDPQRTTIGRCSREIGYAWLAATTNQEAIKMHPPGEVYGQAVAVGSPLVHVRVSNGVPADAGRDRADADGSDGRVFFTSAGGENTRNNVVVQQSDTGSQEETGSERALRVLFAHLHALVFAQSHFMEVRDGLKLTEKAPLQEAVASMIKRLQQFELSTPKSENDEDFSRAMTIWGDRFSGQSTLLTERLEGLALEIKKPTPIKMGMDWMNSVFQLVIKTGVEAAVTATIRTGP